ncbi:MAG: hypothetical protein ACXWEW_11860 [Nitrososphaeraceae archaeon]
MKNIQIASLAFQNMHKRYESVLDVFKPSRGVIGFTEQNLVHNYMNALDNLLGDDCIEWAEFPWGVDGRLHIDGFVFSKKKRAIFYIEAKRLRLPQQVSKLNNDINKIIDYYNTEENFIEELSKHINDDPKNYMHYLITIADIWHEKKWQPIFTEAWKTKKLPDKFIEQEYLSAFINIADSSAIASNSRPNYNFLFAIADLSIFKKNTDA